MQLITVIHEIAIASRLRCSNDCDYLKIKVIAGSEQCPLARCTLFNHALTWDKRYQYHGYLRCAACKVAPEEPKPAPKLRRCEVCGGPGPVRYFSRGDHGAGPMHTWDRYACEGCRTGKNPKP